MGSRFEREAIVVDVERVLIVLKCDVDKDFARHEGCSKGKRWGLGGMIQGQAGAHQVYRYLKWRCEYSLKRFKLLEYRVPRMMKHYARLG